LSEARRWCVERCEALSAWLYEQAMQLTATAGVVLVGVGVGMHDMGAGLAVAGLLMIALVVFSVLLPRWLR
jgi:hypothetical protein